MHLRFVRPAILAVILAALSPVCASIGGLDTTYVPVGLFYDLANEEDVIYVVPKIYYSNGSPHTAVSQVAAPCPMERVIMGDGSLPDVNMASWLGIRLQLDENDPSGNSPQKGWIVSVDLTSSSLVTGSHRESVVYDNTSFESSQLIASVIYCALLSLDAESECPVNVKILGASSLSAVEKMQGLLRWNPGTKRVKTGSLGGYRLAPYKAGYKCVPVDRKAAE